TSSPRRISAALWSRCASAWPTSWSTTSSHCSTARLRPIASIRRCCGSDDQPLMRGRVDARFERAMEMRGRRNVAAPSLERLMARVLIAVADSPFPSLDPAKAALAGIDFEMRMAKSPAPEDILTVARDADAILVTFARLDGPLLRQLTRCKSIGRFGLGVDNIDLKTAGELGITVNYVPDYCMQEVSDHAMAMLLAL